jgi:homoserine kinase
MNNSIRAFAPASIGNIGCGFDVMGLCIEQPGDEVILKLNNSKKKSFQKIIGDNFNLTNDSAKNIA